MWELQKAVRDRWRETPRRAKEQSSGSASRRPYRLQNQSLWGLVLFDLSTAICTVSTFPILKSSPLLAFKTGHILSFLLLLWLLLSRLGFTPCQTICPLSVGGVEREDNLTESKTNQFSYTLRKLDPLFNFYSVAVWLSHSPPLHPPFQPLRRRPSSSLEGWDVPWQSEVELNLDLIGNLVPKVFRIHGFVIFKRLSSQSGLSHSAYTASSNRCLGMSSYSVISQSNTPAPHPLPGSLSQSQAPPHPRNLDVSSKPLSSTSQSFNCQIVPIFISQVFSIHLLLSVPTTTISQRLLSSLTDAHANLSER